MMPRYRFPAVRRQMREADLVASITRAIEAAQPADEIDDEPQALRTLDDPSPPGGAPSDRMCGVL